MTAFYATYTTSSLFRQVSYRVVFTHRVQEVISNTSELNYRLVYVDAIWNVNDCFDLLNYIHTTFDVVGSVNIITLNNSGVPDNPHIDGDLL